MNRKTLTLGAAFGVACALALAAGWWANLPPTQGGDTRGRSGRTEIFLRTTVAPDGAWHTIVEQDDTPAVEHRWQEENRYSVVHESGNVTIADRATLHKLLNYKDDDNEK